MAAKISDMTELTDPQDVDEIEMRDDSETPDDDAQNKRFTYLSMKAASSWKQPCRIATETNDSLSGLAARDGITPVAGNRVLVKAQSSASANGIYIAASGAWTRATDFDTNTKAIANIFVPIEEGTVNADKVFQLTTNNPITIGSTNLTFAEFGAAAGGAPSAFGVANANDSVGGSEYYVICGGNPAGNSTEDDQAVAWAIAATFQNMTVEIPSNNNFTMRFRINGGNGNQVITQSTAGTFTDAVNTDAVTKDQEINYHMNEDSGATTVDSMSIEMVAT